MQQKTLKSGVIIEGAGLHSGKKSRVMISPAETDFGIRFAVDGRQIPATYDNVYDTRLCTCLGSEQAGVSTIEHVMFALRAHGITNALIETDSREMPICDGSAKVWFDAIQPAIQDKPAKVLEILQPVMVQSGDSWAKFEPYDQALFDVTVDYGRAIRKQSASVDMRDMEKLARIASARTFCLWNWVLMMKLTGRARGGNFGNAIIVGPFGKVLNRGGLKFEDEFAAHKLLDAIGDMHMAGYLIKGRYEGHKAGHGRNIELLRAVFSNSDNYRIAIS
ncbi:MAG: UDP-3-O-acyl-N-acetylglucosamine deacetylase [Alphaproteobacteria bacterium]|nr:UDP-3-O-acyl-N-acetylglucosamine deacetylase [Alphaproteobacteria bacterium]